MAGSQTGSTGSAASLSPNPKTLKPASEKKKRRLSQSLETTKDNYTITRAHSDRESHTDSKSRQRLEEKYDVKIVGNTVTWKPKDDKVLGAGSFGRVIEEYQISLSDFKKIISEEHETFTLEAYVPENEDKFKSVARKVIIDESSIIEQKDIEHQHCVSIKRLSDNPYVVDSELSVSESSSFVMEKGEPLPLSYNAIHIDISNIRGLCSPIIELHKEGESLVDIKLENCVAIDGVVKWIDPTVSPIQTETTSGISSHPKTLYTASPEEILKRPLTEKSAVFSLASELMRVACTTETKITLLSLTKETQVFPGTEESAMIYSSKLGNKMSREQEIDLNIARTEMLKMLSGESLKRFGITPPSNKRHLEKALNDLATVLVDAQSITPSKRPTLEEFCDKLDLLKSYCENIQA